MVDAFGAPAKRDGQGARGRSRVRARVVSSGFRPAPWLAGPHGQTLWPNSVRRRARPPVTVERVDTPDGDFLDLAWAEGGNGPLVLLLHGLEGSLRSPYVVGMLDALRRRGYAAVVMHFRGCSGEPNRRTRGYHSGETGDLAFVVGELRRRYPDRVLAVIGYSLGGNVLLKWLGECAETAPVEAAVAVSVPFDLAAVAARLERGFSRFYQWVLLRRMRANLRRKLRRVPLPLDGVRIASLTSFRRFDQAVTAPLHGFAGVDDYYARSSSRQYLASVHTPTLILHALDDPFMTPEVVPRHEELGPGITLELSTTGGHVGFVSGAAPWAARYWLEGRIIEHLEQALRGALRP